MYVCIYVYIYIYIYYTYVCMYVCMYVCKVLSCLKKVLDARLQVNNERLQIIFLLSLLGLLSFFINIIFFQYLFIYTHVSLE